MKEFFHVWVFLFYVISSVQCITYTVTNEVYLDVTIDDKPIGRIVIGLFGKAVPKTVLNFVALATEGINGKTYAGTKFHRSVKRFMIQGGDVVNNDGTGSISIFGKYFDDENFDISHAGAGFVSMANAGKNTNGCQFFITLVPTGWLDGLHTVFGKVIQGFDVVYKIEQVKTDAEDRPKEPVVIYECGEIPLSSPYDLSVEDYYDVWSWIKASAIPLGFSFSILGLFHWMIRQMDV